MNKFSTTQTSLDYYQEQPKNKNNNNSNNTIFSPYNPSTTNVHDELNLKDNIVIKPVSRMKRSRSSRKSPITLLNANVNNFRTLVQQYTGCQRANSSFDLKMRKGPINLSFAGGENEVKEDVKTISVGSNTTSSEGVGYNNNDYYYQETSQVMPGGHHQTFGNRRNNLLSSKGSDISGDMLSVDDYFMENSNTSFSW